MNSEPSNIEEAINSLSYEQQLKHPSPNVKEEALYDDLDQSEYTEEEEINVLCSSSMPVYPTLEIPVDFTIPKTPVDKNEEFTISKASEDKNEDILKAPVVKKEDSTISKTTLDKNEEFTIINSLVNKNEDIPKAPVDKNEDSTISKTPVDKNEDSTIPVNKNEDFAISIALEDKNEDVTMTENLDSDSDSDSSISDFEMADINDFEQAMISVDQVFYEEEMGLGSEPLRTKNEITDIIINKTTLEIKPDMHLTEIGFILHVVKNQVVVKPSVTGECNILDVGTVLVLDNRELLGEIFETIGPVTHPMYVVRFNDSSEINKEKVIKDAKVFRVNELSHFVFIGEISVHKGCDASNLYDEEVNEEEIEFSDDEKEKLYNAMQKRKMKDSITTNRGERGNRGNRRNRGRGNRGAHHPYPPRNDHGENGTVDSTVNRVDSDFDYNILTRPPG